MNTVNTLGERIEDYEVYHLLGKGGFASVYQAKCLRTKIEVAIKMINKKMMQAAGMVNRVRQEVTIHSRLKHPSILELYNFFEDANYVYLILELCHNGELQHYIKQKILGENEAANIMKQVVKGIKYLHSHNILHRDISLSNLLLTKDMQVKIADFGLAAQLNCPEEKHMTMCGTPNFISPEVASRNSHGLQADVWSLGCLLYTLLVGKPPFDTQGVKSTLNKVVNANYELPAHLSAEAKDLIYNLLQKNPNDRITLDQILEHSFIRRSMFISANLTEDSGIHTMSSKRESAFSNSAVRQMISGSPCMSRRANSDYAPQEPLPVNRLTQSMEHLMRDVRTYETSSPRPYACSSRACISQCCISENPTSCQESCSNCRSSFNDGRRYQESLQKNSGHCAPCTPYQNLYSDPGGQDMILNGLHHFKTPSPPLVNEAKNYHLDQCSARPMSDSAQTSEGYRTNKIIKPYQELTKERRTSPKICSLIPLKSVRLQPTKHQTKNAVLSILEGGEVCVEFIKKRGHLKREMVCEIMRISPDGLRVIIYEPDGGRGEPLLERPSPIPSRAADLSYTLENLPEKHWKKYIYAQKFVNLVKAKTPKVTYYSDKAKCLLMESISDFEAHFFDGGKVIQSSTEGIVLNDLSGDKYHFKKPEECEVLTGHLCFMWNHTIECQKHCVLLEKTLSTIPGSNFPVIIGRRPCNLSSIQRKENSVPIVPPTFALSINSNATTTTTASNSSHLKEKQVVVPGIGIAIQSANGEVKIKYPDNSQLTVDGKSCVKYQDPDGSLMKFNENDKIPKYVMDKLQQMPKVLRVLMTSASENSRKLHSYR